jgi:BlaI family transcriptional regulator, penicillinase repressor
MPELKNLSQTELEVMEVLWAKKEATIRDIHGELTKKRDLAYTTVATMLSRLREKGYVEAEEENFKYIFRPLLPKENVMRRKIEDFVKGVLSGNLAPLAAYLREGRNLSPEEVEVLEKIVETEPETDER